jgi:predicted DNA binding CopG/RHH family protein
MKKRHKTHSEADEREFWLTHDSADHVDWSQARRLSFPNLKPSTRTISLRLPEALLDHVKILANARDIPYQSLLKVLLAERVAEVLEERRPKTSFFWVHFTIGDVFPAESVLSAWIAGLATIANDLVFLHDPLLSDFEEEVSATVYAFWLLCAQYREAAKFIASGLDEPAVKRFNKRLDPEAQDIWRRIHASFEPWKGSFVERVAKPIRDRLFHYPGVREPEWSGILAAHSSTESGICFRGSRRVRDTRAVFADDLRASLLSQYLGMSSTEMADSMSELGGLVGMLARVSNQSVAVYLQQVPPTKVEVAQAPPDAKWLEERAVEIPGRVSDGV